MMISSVPSAFSADRLVTLAAGYNSSSAQFPGGFGLGSNWVPSVVLSMSNDRKLSLLSSSPFLFPHSRLSGTSKKSSFVEMRARNLATFATAHSTPELRMT